MGKFSNFLEDVGGVANDVIELGGDYIGNTLDLESAKIDRITTNSEIARAQAASKLQSEKEQRELIRTVVIWGFGLIALVTLINTLNKVGAFKKIFG